MLTLAGCASSKRGVVSAPEDTEAPAAVSPTPSVGERHCGSKRPPASEVDLHAVLRLDKVDRDSSAPRGPLVLRNDGSSQVFVHLDYPNALAFAVDDSGTIQSTEGGPAVARERLLKLGPGESTSVPAVAGTLRCDHATPDDRLATGTYRFATLISLATSQQGETSRVMSEPAEARVTPAAD